MAIRKMTNKVKKSYMNGLRRAEKQNRVLSNGVYRGTLSAQGRTARAVTTATQEANFSRLIGRKRNKRK